MAEGAKIGLTAAAVAPQEEAARRGDDRCTEGPPGFQSPPLCPREDQGGDEEARDSAAVHPSVKPPRLARLRYFRSCCET